MYNSNPIFLLQVNVMEKARSLATDHCTTLQEKCIGRVAKKYTPDDFKSGMYLSFKQYNTSTMEYN